MAAKIISVSPGFIWTPPAPERLWFFPDGSEYLKYSPHFHLIHKGGFRMNLPLSDVFIVVLEGKLSVKGYHGHTMERITVVDQVWYKRGTRSEATEIYRWSTLKRRLRAA